MIQWSTDNHNVMTSLRWGDHEVLRNHDIPIPIGDFCKLHVMAEHVGPGGKRYRVHYWAQLATGQWYRFSGADRTWEPSPEPPTR